MNRRTAEAAAYLGIKAQTLCNWRTQGRGPRFLKIGSRVVYPESELEAFRASCLRASTAEKTAA